jgi:predicted DNA-binding transcriptional regulator YafY
MRASRLLSLLLLLQARGRMSARDLADELEVSLRTVYRDVESLGAAGVPMYADHGPGGGYQLIGGYRTRLTGLSGDEAESLFLAGMPGAAVELGLGAVLASAELKLLAALPPELRSRAGRIRERFHLDAPGWFQDADQTPHLAAVADAVWNQHPLRVRYLRAGRAGERVRLLEPLGVVLKAGAWYLVARARPTAPSDSPDSTVSAAHARAHDDADLARQVRIYRVSRILELETLGERFERPEGFDLAANWRSWSHGYETRVYRYEATVRLSARGRELLPYLLGPLVTRAAEATASPPDADGWVRAVLPIESIPHAVGDLLRLGAEVEVLAPDELRERIAETIGTLAVTYRLSAPLALPSSPVSLDHP